ncbi:DUF2306 domain-containing protein [Paeniglutamicibacter sp. R2-26]|uniref:DUF2306 domain-containing protein n=1 Tax=Paeniglutamicibacter sp. R2-26 TaxID=3144417 RepID=UPI003EE4302C
MRQRSRSGRLAITGLLLLSALPVLGGAIHLGDLNAGPEGTRPLTSSIPMIGHIVAMSAYCLIGAFQFSPALRIRHRWHRAAGRALVPAGFIAALSSVWLAVFFGGPAEEIPLARVRLVFAVAMAVFLVRAVIAIKRRDFAVHGSWMTRAYAIAVSGGSQALVFALWTITMGEVDALGEVWMVAAGFVINSVAAELIVRRRSGRRTSRAPDPGLPQS